MEHTNINIETNKQWEHARSAEALVQKKARLAELEYIRGLFNDRLPVGEELTNIQSYFDHLEQVIQSNGTIQNEQFPPEQPLIDPENGTDVPYRYYSPAIHQQRALEGGGDSGKCSDQSRLRLLSDEQDVDHTTSPRGCDDVQGQSQESAHLSHVAQRKKGLESVYEELGLSDGSSDSDDQEGKLGCCKPS